MSSCCINKYCRNFTVGNYNCHSTTTVPSTSNLKPQTSNLNPQPEAPQAKAPQVKAPGPEAPGPKAQNEDLAAV